MTAAPHVHRLARWAFAAFVAVAAFAANPAPGVAQAPNATKLFAYYYIWYQPSSWNRAKTDYPLLGRYSSDETTILRRHVQLAKDAGIDGFIVSWKSTPTLDERLEKLVTVAQEEEFELTVIYQGLDFERRPLPADRVAADFDTFTRRYGDEPVFSDPLGEPPLMIWSGSWEFSRAEIAGVTRGREDLRVLATERNAEDYEAKADLFDGNAYYWSSVNPDTYPDYPGKLQEMADAVHARGGVWIPPAAPGFDARLIGGTTVVERKDGEQLATQLDVAQGSDPDLIGLISWNEFSENSHVEPSVEHGTTALETIADIRGTTLEAVDDLDSSSPAEGASGPSALTALVLFAALMGGFALLVARRRPPRPNTT